MRSKKNIFWGIVFLVIAAFIIAGAMGAFGEIGFWTLFFTMFLVIWFIHSLLKLSWGGILFSLAFFAILYDKMLGIENLTPWPVLFAALFGSVGLNIIFGKKKYMKSGKWSSDVENKLDDYFKKGISFEYSDDAKSFGENFDDNENSFKSTVEFAETTKYVNCQSLKEALITNSFGESTIYFDGASLENGKAEVYVKCEFGDITLYIPKEWHVYASIERSFGECSIYGECAAESENTLYLSGTVSFGEISIHYI